ncbi:MAG: Gfo/Idh/MocA family oxidoreductase [Gemmataceae bacterium]|nr:Gfo/Idh/MocA family oxidoreductase [Gemmataceae bacterium]MCI0741296.1 Gfo/Idh/MocA family oxidoreductase [Gemmataceae bacterium]
MKKLLAAFFGFTLLALVPLAHAQEKKILRAGLIGLDTSHVIAFTKLLNNPRNEGDLAGVRVVAGFPGGSKDIPDSANRVDKFTAQLRDEMGIEIVASIDELVGKVDVVLLESVDGRPHLQQVIPVLKAGKLVFIDKPIAGSLADVLLIFELSAKYKVPLFSSSSLRYYPGITGAKKNDRLGDILGATVHGPCSLEKHHPDLFWYGIHGVESLFTIMGTGCQSVVRTHTADTDVVTGTWKDGRLGTFRGIRKGASGYGGQVFGAKGIHTLDSKGGSYEPLVREIVRFFQTGQAPVSAEETIEIFAFMEAADESKRQGGAPVTLAGVLEKARAENAQRRLP